MNFWIASDRSLIQDVAMALDVSQLTGEEVADRIFELEIITVTLDDEQGDSGRYYRWSGKTALIPKCILKINQIQ